MTTHHTYLLSNLSVNQFIEFQVAESDDVLAAARARLQDSGLSDDVQGGFFVSVYPTGAETIEEDLDQNPVAVPEATTAHESDAGPLAAAAAQGALNWPEDPQADPPGAPLRSDQADGEVPYVVVPLGGH